MIGAMTKGRGMRGLISYLLASRDHNNEPRPEAVVIGGSIIGSDADNISRQYSAWRHLNIDATNPVIHESLSPTVEDRKLTHQEMSEIGRRWAEAMGYEAYTIVSHGDHLHVAALRIKSDGKLVSTWQDYEKSERIVRSIEKEFGLRKVEASHLLEPERAATHRRATTKGQAKCLEIKGELPPAQRVAAAIDAILADKPTRDEFEKRLEECGINVRANIASTGKLNGYAYSIGKITVTSKALGRGYTLSNLQKRGLDLFGVKKHEQNQQLAPAGAGQSRGNPGNPEANQRVASSDRVEPRKNITGNQRVASSGVFPGGATTAGPRPADRSRVDARRPRHGNAQYPENTHELVSKENRTMETASPSISPAAPAPARLPSGPAIHRHRRTDGNEWWPASANELSKEAGVPLSDIEWWRYQSTTGNGIDEPRLLIGLTDGSEIELRHDGVSASHATPTAESAMIALADRRGWTSVTLSGSDDVKRRLARELIARGVVVVNPEMKEYCEQVARELAAERTAVFIQPAAPVRSKLGLFGWREKRQPAPAPEPAPQALAEPMATGHQVVADETAAPTTKDAEIDYLALEQSIKSAAAQAAGLDEVDGVLTYQQNVKAHQLAELVWGHDQGMLTSYRAVLEADEKGYPWSPGMREKLRQLGEALDNGEVDQAQELFYEANLQTGHDADSFARLYCREYDEARELKNENRPT